MTGDELLDAVTTVERYLIHSAQSRRVADMLSDLRGVALKTAAELDAAKARAVPDVEPAVRTYVVEYLRASLYQLRQRGHSDEFLEQFRAIMQAIAAAEAAKEQKS